MQAITLDIPIDDFVAGDTFAVYGNIDANGCAVAAIDTTKAITGDKPMAFVPSTPVGIGYGEIGAGGGVADSSPAVRPVRTPGLFWGVYRFVVRTFDVLGNGSSLVSPAEFAVHVNSGPRAVGNFRQTSVNAAGRPVFSFDPPAQMK